MCKWENAVGHPWTMEWLFNLSTVSRSNWKFEELFSVGVSKPGRGET